MTAPIWIDPPSSWSCDNTECSELDVAKEAVFPIMATEPVHCGVCGEHCTRTDVAVTPVEEAEPIGSEPATEE